MVGNSTDVLLMLVKNAARSGVGVSADKVARTRNLRVRE